MNRPSPAFVAIKIISLLLASVAMLVACGAGRSPLPSVDDQPAGGSLPGTGGGITRTGGGKTGGAGGFGGVATGGYFQGTGGRPGTGGWIIGTGGVGTGGRIFPTGGTIPNTGGFMVLTGGIPQRTGGWIINTGGSVIRTGGLVVGTGGVIPRTGGIVVPPDAGTLDTRPICGPTCNLYCPYGYRLDSSGCPLCACNPPPDASPPDSFVDTRNCPVVSCPGLLCPYGFVTDDQGCPTCRCSAGPDGCPPVMCKPCPHGFAKDAKGCFNCECIPDPAIPCNQFTYSSTCNASTRNCRWLAPGCDSPALTSSGCYESEQLDCDGTCPNGLMCLKRSIHPCPGGNCGACGSFMAVCL